MSSATFDYIIVGAGAAGSVLAGRLSADPAIEVLLIEAGPDAPPGKEDPTIRYPYPRSMYEPRFTWPDLAAEIGADPGNGTPRLSSKYAQGRGVGGGSNINGMLAFRGRPEDYDEWRDSGAAGWGWEDVLPHFRSLEHDQDFDGPMHGDTGPIPIRRVKPERWTPFAKAFAEVVCSRGYPLLADFNGDFREGVSSIPMSNLPNRRVSASMGFLDQAARRRPNLTILTNLYVERIVMDGRKATGVIARTATGRETFTARETIIASGGIHSPAILMRSGIGPASHLRELGIEVLQDLPGVGQHLMNHPAMLVMVHLPRRSIPPSSDLGMAQNALRFSSGVEACSPNDLSLCLISNNGSSSPLGRRVGMLIMTIEKSYSRGEVRLKSADPEIEPEVKFNVLSDPRDFQRAVLGLKLCYELLTDERLRAVTNEAFLPIGRRAALENNWLLGSIASAVLDIAPLRRSLLGPSRLLNPAALAKDPAALEKLVREHVGLAYHVSCTARMGRPGDPGIVVDPGCRVVGVEGLRVIDASVMPAIVGGYLHIPVLMIAEKMAYELRHGSRANVQNVSTRLTA